MKAAAPSKEESKSSKDSLDELMSIYLEKKDDTLRIKTLHRELHQDS